MKPFAASNKRKDVRLATTISAEKCKVRILDNLAFDRVKSIFHRSKGSSPSAVITIPGREYSDGTSTEIDHANAVRTNVGQSEETLRLGVDAAPALPIIDSIGFDGESDHSIGLTDKGATALQTRSSVSELSRRISQRSSPDFLVSPTVVYRPKLESRPTVLSVAFGQQVDDAINGRGLSEIRGDSSSSPSQVFSAGGGSSPPPSFQSTAPTSPTSSGAPRSAETAQRTQQRYNSVQTVETPLYEKTLEQTESQWLVFPQQNAPRLSQPSIATVEKAAAAKIALESHFDSLLSTKPSPRSLRRRHFERKMFAMGLSVEKRLEQRQQLTFAETSHLRQTRVLKSKTLARQSMRGVHASNYEIVRVLGKGSFGVVRLVCERSENTSNRDSSGTDGSTKVSGMDGANVASSPSKESRSIKQVYAMKVIRKSDMLRNSQEGHLRAERDFLVASENSRWVVPLIASFQDNINLYLVMEYMIGGDFLGLLLREDILDENVAK
ncbi:unnamed protein product [Periconia digitata]|uniref:non-specific serine/threonine protein kinase n=1 Tax=Periconia digitata TaxID=1303443 RepID=A0A9W4UJD8_9PLEO|nr:unnamed protein product [Periconia digitata]